MNNEKTHMCNCKEADKKFISVLKDNGKLLHMIRDLRKENERLSGEFGRRSSWPEVRPLRVEIHHEWKKDYEELQMHHEMLSGGKRLLEEEERIGDFEKRPGPLESEITRLATYKEDFERERHQDREKIYEENEKLKRELESAEEIIKMLTTQFDVVCRENRALEERPALPVPVRHQRQLVQPFAMGMDSL